MACNPNGAAFNPTEWLAAFEAVGGWFAVDVDERISLGWFVYGRTEQEQDEARRLYREIEHIDERWMAVKAHVCSSRRVPA